MRLIPSLLNTATVLITITSAAYASAQGGSCKDPWINQAYNQLYGRAPSGSGITGDCNIKLYGNGQWTTFADLTSKVVAVRGRATKLQPASSAPSTTQLGSIPYNPSQHPVSSAQLSLSNTSAAVAARNASLTQYHVDFGGNLVGPAGLLLARSGQFLISASIVAQGGGNIVAQGGGNIVAQGGGNVMPSAGMLINATSSNFIVGR